MHRWDPDRYLTYADERGRPFVDLLARWRDGGLPDVTLSVVWRDRLSRRTRVEEMAAVLRSTLD